MFRSPLILAGTVTIATLGVVVTLLGEQLLARVPDTRFRRGRGSAAVDSRRVVGCIVRSQSMGFMRLTPRNAKATHVAGATAFVFGGAAIFLAGAVGMLLAAAQVIEFSWEQIALMLLGAAVAVIGLVIVISL